MYFEKLWASEVLSTGESWSKYFIFCFQVYVLTVLLEIGVKLKKQESF